MNVVYALTRDFYHKMIPSVTSLLEHNKDVKIYLLGEDDEVQLPFPVHIINVSQLGTFNKSTNAGNYFKYVNLMKVRYPSLIPEDRVMHLDADTIICDSLEEMWGTDLEGKWIGAVQEYRGHYHPFGERYYNAGVMVLNLAQLRADGAEEPMTDYLMRVRQPYADQDAWNKYGLAEDKIVDLPIRFNENCMTGFTDDPAIVHYCSITDWWTNRNMYRWELLSHYQNSPLGAGGDEC